MKKNITVICLLFLAGAIFAQNTDASSANTELPLRRIGLFSSGVGYFEHSGPVQGNARINLSFELSAVNDVLKSLVINDPGGAPSISYSAEDTLERALQSLNIDLSRNPGVAELFAAQRGSEIEVFAPNSISGRILGVETRSTGVGPFGNAQMESFLSLNTSEGIRVIALTNIASFRWIDPSLTADLQRALDLIAANRTVRNRILSVNLPGTANRSVALSYVIAAPVWKVSYRLDLGQRQPLFQGWAIIDNASDMDWNNVELSLIAGRPVSFIQQLYPLYFNARSTLPLAIAGSAMARTYDSGFGRNDQALAADMEMAVAEEMAVFGYMRDAAPAAARQIAPAPSVSAVQAAGAASAVGDQFAFTVRNPVTINRRQSAMIPMVSGTMTAAKTLVISGSRALSGTIHPDLTAELTNTTGMKLPAGPITVFDGGTYAGDALIEFFGENDKRLIKYGEDLSVTATAAHSTGARTVSTVTITGGVMTINRRQIHERNYSVRNTSSEAKRLIIEHPITANSTLVEPRQFLERTDSLYRFETNLQANRELTFTVREEVPLSERITLGQLRPENLLSYSTSQEIPANVRAALTRAVELRNRADAARQTQNELETSRTRLTSEQDRVRQNLNAVGTSSELGIEYMRRMSVLDNDIDRLNREIEQAVIQLRNAQRELDDYIAGLRL